MDTYTLALIIARRRLGAGWVCVLLALPLPVAERAASVISVDLAPRLESREEATSTHGRRLTDATGALPPIVATGGFGSP